MVELTTSGTYWYWDNKDPEDNTLTLLIENKPTGIAIHRMPDSEDPSYLEYFVKQIRDDYPDLPVVVYDPEPED
jgi:hypothetical protein